MGRRARPDYARNTRDIKFCALPRNAFIPLVYSGLVGRARRVWHGVTGLARSPRGRASWVISPGGDYCYSRRLAGVWWAVVWNDVRLLLRVESVKLFCKGILKEIGFADEITMG